MKHRLTGAALFTAACLMAAGPGALPEHGKDGALMSAIVESDASAVRLLLARGADPNARNANGGTPLVLAAGDYEKVTALVEKGADVNGRSAMGRAPLHAAAAQRDSFRVVRYLIAKGADVNARDNSPEFLSGGTGSTPLMLATRSMDNRTVQLLLEKAADVNAATSTGSTALIDALSARNPGAVRLLLDHGARVNFTFGHIKQTPLIWASFQECPQVVEMLLAAGADVHAKDALGSTALVWASMSERDDVRTVSALLRAGASPDVKTAMNETPLSWAQRRGNTGIVRLLAKDVPQSVAAQEPIAEPGNPPEARQAVEKSLTTLLPSGPVFMKGSGCVSCHNNTLPLMAASMARGRGLAVDAANEVSQRRMVLGFLAGLREPLLESAYAVPDTQVSVPYLLLALKAEGVQADELTSAAVHAVASRQLPDGHWPSYIDRAPLENGDIQATALSLRSIRIYGAPGRAAEWDRRVSAARAWLLKAQPTTTEDKVMRLCGLVWAGAPHSAIADAASALKSLQQPDGGFAQLDTLSSDAYATGKVMVALIESGEITTGTEEYRRAAEWLLNHREKDGTWRVQTRAFPFQPLKESGFPHGRDQWISAAATSWAAMALTESVEPASQQAP